MDKVKLQIDEQGDLTLLSLWDVWRRQDEIIDWINDSEPPLQELVESINKIESRLNVHDEATEDMLDQIRANSALIEGRFRGWGKAKELLDKATKPTIEQEIEAGLIECESGQYWCVDKEHLNYPRCTRIYLPEGKYDEYVGTGPKEGVMFHGIPVYCGGPDIHYCTD